MTEHQGWLLLLLATKLRTMPPERFNMDWYRVKKNCGTVCCAMGWAMDVPEIREAGKPLGLRWVGDSPVTSSGTVNPEGTVGGFIGDDLFGLTCDERDQLFYFPPRTPVGKAMQIVRLVRQHHPGLKLETIP